MMRLAVALAAAATAAAEVAQSEDWLVSAGPDKKAVRGRLLLDLFSLRFVCLAVSTGSALTAVRARTALQALTVTKDSSGAIAALSLTNGLVERAFTVRGGALCTTEYMNLVSAQTFFRAISPEANLTLSGTPFVSPHDLCSAPACGDRAGRAGRRRLRRPAEQDHGVLDAGESPLHAVRRRRIPRSARDGA